jgi:hypothetical protein
MITSNQIIKLLEKHLQSVNVFGGNVDVFINPDSSDYKELYQTSKYKSIKFIADGQFNRLYVWNADKGMHREIIRQLGLETRFSRTDVLSGDAKLESGKLTMNDSDLLDNLYKKSVNRDKVSQKHLFAILDNDWSWVEHYITCHYWLTGFTGMVKGHLS